MYYVYTLRSIASGNLYIGVSDDPHRRLSEHNSGKTRSTKPHIPYILIYVEKHVSKEEALKRERQIKRSGKIRKALKEGTYQGPIV